MTKLVLALALALCATTYADLSTCSYVGKATQADDGDGSYDYCNDDGTLTPRGQTSPGKLTANVAGTAGMCQTLEPDLTDQELIDTLGLYTRPNYKGSFTQDGDSITFSLDQYGDSQCAYIQRHIEVEWGVDYCVEAQDVSQGIVHDLYFNDDTCGDFGSSWSELQRKNEALNGFDNIQDSLFDPWRVITVLVNGTRGYQYNTNVSTQSFTQDDGYTPQTSLCYGTGDEFAPPYYISELWVDGNDTFVRNHVHAPFPFAYGDRVATGAMGYLCGYDCTDDIDAAMANFYSNVGGGMDPAVASVYLALDFANSTCGVAYAMMEEYDTAANPLTLGLPQDTVLQALLFLDVGRTRQCGVCETYSPANPAFNDLSVIGRIGATTRQAELASVNAGSRYNFCQTDVVMTNYLWIDPASTDVDCDDATSNSPSPSPTVGTGSTDASFAVSALFALVSSLLVALFN